MRFFRYFAGIKFKQNRIHVATTGAEIKIDIAFWKSAASVIQIYFYFLARRIKQIFTRPQVFGTIVSYPQTPGPWYTIWQVMRLAGLRRTDDMRSADYIFIFEDKTFAEFEANALKNFDAKLINYSVRDISKNHVGDVFKSVFGYPIRVDPLRYHGPAICKSNANGTHDGVVINLPIERADVSEQHTYQRLVDSVFQDGVSEDLRIAYVLGEIALVYHKYKPLGDRFGTDYLKVDIKHPSDVFSKEEIELIIQFCKRMGLDFGAVDVMRDKNDGRIYIVDVNKTCMPVLSLDLKTQIQCQKKIANAFRRRLLA